MSGKIEFDNMIQKQQLNLLKLQQRLNEMKKEYEMYKDVIDKLKNQIPSNTLMNKNNSIL